MSTFLLSYQFMISIHALREEGDTAAERPPLLDIIFLSTPSARRATQRSLSWGHTRIISIHALREEGDGEIKENIEGLVGISIHALREEGDVPGQPPPQAGLSISIHALREEGDAILCVCARSLVKFLSTPSARRATPHGRELPQGAGISIHALREEGDRMNTRKQIMDTRFLSTPSARRATCICTLPMLPGSHFYPRPPRGGRRAGEVSDCERRGISIHALREEGDDKGFFQPPVERISIHALREEGDGFTIAPAVT